MIASIRGTVAGLRPDSAVIEVGGVGFAVQCTPGTLAGLRVGGEASLVTALVVREDSLTLFGFACAEEREVFEVLQTATGVGPRLAQAVLAVHSPDEVRRAVATEDLRALTLVPGIGRKGAQRIVVELKDRLGPPRAAAATATPVVGVADWQEQLRTALAGLGYSAREAEEAVRQTVPDDPEAPDLAVLLRSALSLLRRP